jgi:hypothetical protein
VVTLGHDKANPKLRWALIAAPLSLLVLPPRSTQQHRRTEYRAADQ